MLKIKKKLTLNLKILRFLIIPTILVLTPFYNVQDVKAGLEFQWEQNTGYKRLKWFQKESGKRARNTIYFFLRPLDRKSSLLRINLKIPKTFKSTLKENKISFCKVKIGGFESRTQCIEEISADIKLNEDNTSLDIFPYSPIPSNKSTYAIVFKVFNPKRTGLYQFHSYGQYLGQESVSSYIGSATILID